MHRYGAQFSAHAGDRVELRVVDAPLARAFFGDIPAARLLARARLASADDAAWQGRAAELAGGSPQTLEAVTRAVARHARVAGTEGPLPADDAALAVLVWAVASDGAAAREGTGHPDLDRSLVEIVPDAGRPTPCDPAVLRACATWDDRLASPSADKRAPAFEACLRLATRAALGPLPWERLRAVAEQLARPPVGLALFGGAPTSVFPYRVDDQIAQSDRRITPLDRRALAGLAAADPRWLGPVASRMGASLGEGGGDFVATFLADLTTLVAHDGTLVAVREPADDDAERASAVSSGAPSSRASWAPSAWSASNAAAVAERLERGEATLSQVRAAVLRGGDAALDAVGAEMLQVSAHPFASSAFAVILAGSARPRDVVRLVTYFAVAPDLVPAVRALDACQAPELPGVLKAWLEAMLPADAADATEAIEAIEAVGAPSDADDGAPSSVARVAACLASLKRCPRLYGAVQPVLARIGDAPPPSA